VWRQALINDDRASAGGRCTGACSANTRDRVHWHISSSRSYSSGCSRLATTTWRERIPCLMAFTLTMFLPAWARGPVERWALRRLDSTFLAHVTWQPCSTCYPRKEVDARSVCNRDTLLQREIIAVKGNRATQPFSAELSRRFLALAQRANTAFLASSFLSSAVILEVRAFPPLSPPSRPSATACGFFCLAMIARLLQVSAR
jgi:hypothetical protein